MLRAVTMMIYCCLCQRNFGRQKLGLSGGYDGRRIYQKKEIVLGLMYCVDFMGERGMQLIDKTVEVNEQIIDRLNGIYNLLWNEWSEMCNV